MVAHMSTLATTITDHEALALRGLQARFEAWRNGCTSYKTDDVPAELRAFDNDARAKLELYDFVHEKPERYFAYYRDNAAAGELIVNWTGLTLGRIESAGAIWTSNFGDKRRSVRVRGVNGVTYIGTAQLSNGTYVRLRAIRETTTQQSA